MGKGTCNVLPVHPAVASDGSQYVILWVSVESYAANVVLLPGVSLAVRTQTLSGVCVRGSLRTRDICNRPHIRSTKPPEYDSLTHLFTATKPTQAVQKESAWTPRCRTAHTGTYRREDVDRSVDSGSSSGGSQDRVGSPSWRGKEGQEQEVPPSTLSLISTPPFFPAIRCTVQHEASIGRIMGRREEGVMGCCS